MRSGTLAFAITGACLASLVGAGAVLRLVQPPPASRAPAAVGWSLLTPAFAEPPTFPAPRRLSPVLALRAAAEARAKENRATESRAPTAPAETPQIHYAPATNLEKIDVAVLDGAARTIDMAAFVLTDYPVIWALQRAAGRGVAIRLLLDRTQHDERPEVKPFEALRQLAAGDAGVAIRIKTGRVYMHLKAYAVDGRRLRTGSANFSASGLKSQDNDLVLIDSPAAAAAFAARFEAMWGQAKPIGEGR